MTSKIVPIYQQIYLTLKNDLERGRYRADLPFPNELVLAKRFGVSRVTLRRTLEMLQREGMVLRKPGIGTFPAPTVGQTKFRSSIESFYNTLSSVSKKYRVKNLDRQMVSTPPYVLKRYPSFGETSLQIKKVSKIKNKPIHFGTHYLPPAMIKDGDHSNTSGGALLWHLKDFGVKSVRTELIISATLADLEAAKILDVQPGSPLIVTNRASINKDGEPIEFMYALTRPDLYEYVFQFAASATNGRMERTD